MLVAGDLLLPYSGSSSSDIDVLRIEEDGRVTIQGSDKTFVGDNFTGTAQTQIYNNLDSTTLFVRYIHYR